MAETKVMKSLNGYEVVDGKARTDLAVLKNGYVPLTPQMFGAKGDGVTDDTAAITATFGAANGVTKVYFPAGKYLVTAPITVNPVPDIEMDGMLEANHNGICLSIGSPDEYTVNKRLRLKASKKVSQGEGSVGIQIGALARSTVDLAFINRFETNVKLLTTKGIFFNTFNIDDLNIAKYGLYLDGTNGWINDNLFIGGSIGKGTDGASITIIHGGSNIFLKNGMEGAGTCVNVVSGGGNQFIYSRCEGSTCALLLGADAGEDNVMLHNYGAGLIGYNKCENLSKVANSGIVDKGIRSICHFPAVNIPVLDEKKFFTRGSNLSSEYFGFMGSGGNEATEVSSACFELSHDALLRKANYRPILKFDTTVNKRFELDRLICIGLVLFGAEGQIELTADNWKNYIKTDSYYSNPGIQSSTTYFQKQISFDNIHMFEVSEEVTQVTLVLSGCDYPATTITGFGIRTQYPCKPIRDEVLNLPAVPDNGYAGAKVCVNGALYIHNGTAWCPITA